MSAEVLPADDNAASLTPVEMTFVNGLDKRGKFKLYRY